MYHLPDATDLLQNNLYYVFYLTEKLLKIPFILCRHWLYQLQTRLHFLLSDGRMPNAPACTEYIQHRVPSQLSLNQLRALQLLTAI